MNRREFFSTMNSALFASLITTPLIRNTCTETPIKVGYFKADVTPPLGSPSYPTYQPLETIETPLWAKGIILEDSQSRYVLCAFDWLGIGNESYYQFRNQIAQLVNTAPDHIFIHSVHQHTAPKCDESAYKIARAIENPPPCPSTEMFQTLFGNVLRAIEETLSNLVPCKTIQLAKVKVEKVASSRRIIQPDGTCKTRFSSCKDPELISAPEGYIDPFLRTVSFTATNGKPIARLHYYATHPQSFYGDKRVSYDFPGMAREEIEKEEGTPHIYFTGCAGDIAAGKYNDGTPEARQILFQRLLTAMQQAVISLEPDKPTPITIKTEPTRLGFRTDGDYAPEQLEAKLKDPQQSPNVRISCSATLAYQRRVEQIPIPISAIHIGPVSILSLPGEPMVDFQIFAQQCVPARHVLTAGYGDYSTAYICTEESFKQGGYEPSASRVAKNAESILKNAIYKVLT